MLRPSRIPYGLRHKKIADVRDETQYRRVANISEDPASSIIRVGISLKVEATGSSQMPVIFFQPT
jgi:hypothetical protein